MSCGPAPGNQPPTIVARQKARGSNVESKFVRPTTPSSADQELIDHARQHATIVSGAQLERWRAHGLLAPNQQRALGRGRGSTSSPAPGSHELVVFLGSQARSGRRRHDLALLALDAGLAVPAEAVRQALAASVKRLKIRAEDSPAPDERQARSDWAWRIAERELSAHSTSTLVPNRMRAIDEQLSEMMTEMNRAVGPFDRGTVGSEPMSAKDIDLLSLVAVLGGGQEIAGPVMAQMLRAFGPHDSASPAASMLEYEDNPDMTQLRDERGLPLIPDGDIRQDLLLVIADASQQDLEVAWRAAGAQRTWALELIAAVEKEIATGIVGPACVQWLAGNVIPLSRMAMRLELRTHRESVSNKASTAVSMLRIGRSLRMLPQVIPGGLFHLLPAILPPFLHELAGIVMDPGIGPSGIPWQTYNALPRVR